MFPGTNEFSSKELGVVGAGTLAGARELSGGIVGVADGVNEFSAGKFSDDVGGAAGPNELARGTFGEVVGGTTLG